MIDEVENAKAGGLVAFNSSSAWGERRLQDDEVEVNLRTHLHRCSASYACVAGNGSSYWAVKL